jgi:hypothetical protein
MLFWEQMAKSITLKTGTRKTTVKRQKITLAVEIVTSSRTHEVSKVSATKKTPAAKTAILSRPHSTASKSITPAKKSPASKKTVASAAQRKSPTSTVKPQVKSIPAKARKKT